MEMPIGMPTARLPRRLRPASRSARSGRAEVVEAQPVDDREVLGQPERTGLVIAGLRLRGDRAQLDEAETEGAPVLMPTPSLSIPAASPIRPGKSMPATVAGETVSGAQPCKGRECRPTMPDSGNCGQGLS